jgi:hypothetical protein
MIAAHDIDCDSHKWKNAEPKPDAAQTGLSARRNGQDLTALVKTAGRADAVRNIRRIALRALAQLRELEDTVISPAHALAAS